MRFDFTVFSSAQFEFVLGSTYLLPKIQTQFFFFFKIQGIALNFRAKIANVFHRFLLSSHLMVETLDDLIPGYVQSIETCLSSLKSAIKNLSHQRSLCKKTGKNHKPWTQYIIDREYHSTVNQND